MAGRTVERRKVYWAERRRAGTAEVRWPAAMRAANDPNSEDERRLWAQRIHASRRAEERYGVRLDGQALRQLAAGMTDTLTKAGLLYLGVEAGGRPGAYWLVVVDRTEMIAVYDPQTRQIATFLPMDAGQVAFARGRFLALANGGSRQARDYWRAR